jgi:hypothetical protein
MEQNNECEKYDYNYIINYTYNEYNKYNKYNKYNEYIYNYPDIDSKTFY